MKKLILFIFVSLLLFTNMSAQTDTAAARKIFCDRVMSNTTYIFEGKYISSKNFRGTDGGYYVSYLLEVQEVIKGQLQKGTVEITAESDNYIGEGGDHVKVQDAMPVVYGGTTLYFCSDAEKATYNSGVVKTNSTPLSVVDVASFSNDKILQHHPYGMFTYFTKISDVYEYLKKNYNIKIGYFTHIDPSVSLQIDPHE